MMENEDVAVSRTDQASSIVVGSTTTIEDVTVTAPGADQATSLAVGLSVGAVVCLAFAAGLLAFLTWRKRKSATAADIHVPPSSTSERVDASELHNLTQIGHGSFGIVYRAEYRNSHVAVKCINESVIGDDADLETEARTLRNLPTHANVVAFRGMCSLENRPALVLEYCEGGSLFVALRNCKLKWTHAMEIRVAYGTAAGVAHLHKCGIVHRDLAARNVLLVSLQTMVPKVTDFGMSRCDADSNVTKSALGAAGWMAPEQMARDGLSNDAFSFSPASDVFSFAVLLFEIFEKRTPWEGFAPFDIRDKVGKGKRINVDTSLYPAGTLALMDSCWNYLPAQRPSMDDVTAMLKGLLAKATEFDDAFADHTNAATKNSPRRRRKSIKVAPTVENVYDDSAPLPPTPLARESMLGDHVPLPMIPN
jgi:serine/threonine protein kinase